jgi:hypothetical protein
MSGTLTPQETRRDEARAVVESDAGVFASNVSYDAMVLTRSPDAYWQLDELSGLIATCSVNIARNGTYKGVTLGQPGIGDGGTSTYFDGAGGSLDLTVAQNLWNGQEGSINFWVKPNLAATLQRYLVVWYDGDNYLIIAQTAVGYNIQWDYRAGGTSEQGSHAIAADPGAFVAVGCTWSKTNERVRYYYDGVEVGSDVNLGTWTGVPTRIILGATTVVPANPLDGWMAHCALFSSEQSAAVMALLATV